MFDAVVYVVCLKNIGFIFGVPYIRDNLAGAEFSNRFLPP